MEWYRYGIIIDMENVKMIAIVGMNGAGKSEAVNYLVENGKSNSARRFASKRVKIGWCGR